MANKVTQGFKHNTQFCYPKSSGRFWTSTLDAKSYGPLGLASGCLAARTVQRVLGPHTQLPPCLCSYFKLELSFFCTVQEPWIWLMTVLQRPGNYKKESSCHKFCLIKNNPQKAIKIEVKLLLFSFLLQFMQVGRGLDGVLCLFLFIKKEIRCWNQHKPVAWQVWDLHTWSPRREVSAHLIASCVITTFCWFNTKCYESQLAHRDISCRTNAIAFRNSS